MPLHRRISVWMSIRGMGLSAPMNESHIIERIRLLYPDLLHPAHAGLSLTARS
jgi:hypothetical protein